MPPLRERAAILAGSSLIGRELFASAGAPAAGVSVAAPAGPATLEDLEKQAITEALKRCSGHRKQAAEQLGIGLRTLYDKLKQYGIG